MARESLQNMLGVESLSGKSFLDVGSGSGLFSLAAAQLGASPVVSFDYDAQSVQCTRLLKERFLPDCDGWSIGPGDVLDRDYVAKLPEFAVVYSWGVLHHTGRMWQAIDNVSKLVKPRGQLYIAIYNDQKWRSDVWRKIKWFYCQGSIQRAIVVSAYVPLFIVAGGIMDLLKRRNPLARYRAPRLRGMSTVRDWYDWLGGYPFEVASPDAVVSYLRDRGFELQKLKSVGTGLGCNEFVFERIDQTVDAD
jgi:2-polyprenyl-6-hydroxyphenyl methylase/3-demethylubiquinone-9 3-methyltransferase